MNMRCEMKYVVNMRCEMKYVVNMRCEMNKKYVCHIV